MKYARSTLAAMIAVALLVALLHRHPPGRDRSAPAGARAAGPAGGRSGPDQGSSPAIADARREAGSKAAANETHGIALPDAIPAGRLRDELSRLTAPARRRALAKLARVQPPREDYDSLHASPDGGIYYTCAVPPEIRAQALAAAAAQAAAAPTSSAASVPLASVPVRHSKSGARYTLYLDFGGGTITGTAWNEAYSQSSYTAQAYDTDGDATTFSDAEQAAILDVWARVAEDYEPFDVDVTTEKPASYTARTAHAMITKHLDANGLDMPSSSSGGIAYIAIFQDYRADRASDVVYYSPALIYADNIVATRPDHIADAAAHELGHNFGLSHDGVTTTSTDNYYFGHGANTATSWAPIMGAGYDKNYTQWSKGEYYLANNTEDDIAIIAANTGFRTDEAGGTIATAAALTAAAGAISTSGVLSQSTDVDVYTFTTASGSVSFNVKGFADATNTHGGDAYFTLELLDGSGSVLTSATAGADVSVSAVLSAGTYYLRLTPAGTGDPTSSSPTGFTSYGSIGQYTLTGTVPVTLTAQTISFPSIAGHVYGDAAFALPATASSGLTVSYTIVSGPATVSGSTLTITGAGDVMVRASQGGDSSYSAASPVDQTFTVAKAALTATADNQSRNYGEANPTLTISYAGFVNGENASVLTSAPTATTTADPSSLAGTYPITLTGGSAANYELTRVDGTLTVVAVNTAPAISAIADQTIAEDTATGTLAFTVGDAETAAASLTVTASSSNQALIPDASIVLGGSGASRTVTVTPAANASGSATITLTVSDGALTTSTSFVVTVTAVNNAPTISAIADQTIAQDTATSALAFTVGDAETAAASLTVTASSSNQALIPDASIVLGGSGASRTVTVTPAANASGSATITLTVSDGALTTSTSFGVTVTAMNHAPAISAIADQTIAEDTATGTLAFTVGDAETAAASLTVTVSSSNQALIPDASIVLGGSGASRTVTVTPAANASSSATITLTVSDGTLTTSTSFVVTVTAVDHAPAISAIADQTIAEDGATGALAFTVGDAETAAASLTVTASSSNQTLIPDASIVLGGSGASRTIILTPVAGATGSATITVTVSDGALTTSTSFTLTVNLATVAATITSGASTTFTVGVPGEFTVTATGTPAPTFSATGLPTWLTLDADTGILSGTAPAGTAGMQLNLVITASNGAGVDATQVFTVNVQAPSTITSALIVSTLAGQAGVSGSTDATGTSARFKHPTGVAVDDAGNIYIADTDNNVIRKITSAGVVTTVAGLAGTAGGADGTGSAATFNAPSGLAVDAAGNLYVADTLNHTIRMVTSAGVISTLAGQAGVSGSADGAATAARFFGPQGLALDAAGKILYVADTNNHTIRRIVLATSLVSTLAGGAGEAGAVDATGRAARFNVPSGVAVDTAGTLYVADSGNNAIRTITTNGAVGTLAGLPGSSGAHDGTGTAARFSQPAAVAVGPVGDVYVLDTDNHTIREIDPSSGTVSTRAGLAGTSGSADGTGDVARFNHPAGLAAASSGEIYIADTDNHAIRLGQQPAAPSIQTQPQSQSVTAGTSVQFSVTASGLPAPTYQWQFDGVAISGATGSSYRIASPQTSDAGDYTVVVSNAFGSITSATAALSVSAATSSTSSSSGSGSGGGGGGGGAPGFVFHAGLALLVATRWLKRRR